MIEPNTKKSKEEEKKKKKRLYDLVRKEVIKNKVLKNLIKFEEKKNIKEDIPSIDTSQN